MLRPDELTRVTWCCLHFAAAGDVTPDLRMALEGAGLIVFDLNGESVRSKDSPPRALAEVMKFPGYFGMNWDAVMDCLRDLEERPPAEGHVLIVHAAEWLWQQGWPWIGSSWRSG